MMNVNYFRLKPDHYINDGFEYSEVVIQNRSFKDEPGWENIETRSFWELAQADLNNHTDLN